MKLGVIPTIAPFLLPRVLKRLRRKYKHLQLYLTEDQTAVLHQKLLDGDIDVALLALPMDLPGIEVREIPSVVGERYFHEVFFTDVEVPASCRLGRSGGVAAAPSDGSPPFPPLLLVSSTCPFSQPKSLVRASVSATGARQTASQARTSEWPHRSARPHRSPSRRSRP